MRKILVAVASSFLLFVSNISAQEIASHKASAPGDTSNDFFRDMPLAARKANTKSKNINFSGLYYGTLSTTSIKPYAPANVRVTCSSDPQFAVQYYIEQMGKKSIVYTPSGDTTIARTKGNKLKGTFHVSNSEQKFELSSVNEFSGKVKIKGTYFLSYGAKCVYTWAGTLSRQ